MRKLVFLILWLFVCQSKAQYNVSYTIVDDTSNYFFSDFVMDEMYKDLSEKALNNSVQLFKPEKSVAIDRQSLIDSVFYTYQNIQIINPKNPWDPYDLIDTVTCFKKKYTDLTELWITGNKVFFKTKKREVFYIQREQFIHLNFAQIIVSALDLKTNNNSEENRIDFLITHYYKSLRNKIYSNVLNRELSLFYTSLCENSDTNYLNGSYNYPFVWRENRQIINPENPEDPYDLIDTVIYHLADSSNLQLNLFASLYATDGTSQIIALSFAQRQQGLSNKTYLRKHDFDTQRWIKWSDVEDILGKTHAQNLIQDYIWHTSNRIH